MWMPAQTTTPPRPTARSAAGHELADGGEDDRRVELLGRGPQRVARPLAAELEREGLRGGVVGAREGEDAPALVAARPGRRCGRWRRSRRGRAAARRRSSAARGGRSARRTAAARPRGRRSPRAARRRSAPSATARVGVAAVAVEAGERARARRGSRARCVQKRHVPSVQPSHGMPTRAPGACVGVRPRREHGGDDLVARDDRQPRAAHLAVADVQVGAAHAAGVDLDEHLAGAAGVELGVGQLAAPAAGGRARRGPSRAPPHDLPSKAWRRAPTASISTGSSSPAERAVASTLGVDARALRVRRHRVRRGSRRRSTSRSTSRA